jgi:hypothetical protein
VASSRGRNARRFRLVPVERAYLGNLFVLDPEAFDQRHRPRLPGAVGAGQVDQAHHPVPAVGRDVVDGDPGNAERLPANA